MGNAANGGAIRRANRGRNQAMGQPSHNPYRVRPRDKAARGARRDGESSRGQGATETDTEGAAQTDTRTIGGGVDNDTGLDT